jgi:hypothetical protein
MNQVASRLDPPSDFEGGHAPRLGFPVETGACNGEAGYAMIGVRV